MNHSKAIYTIDAYRRDELSDRVREELDAHLRTCSECSAYAESSAVLTTQLQELGSQVPARFEATLDSLHRSTMTAVRRESERPESFLAWALGWARPQVLAPAGATAALALLGFLLVATSQKSPAPRGPLGD